MKTVHNFRFWLTAESLKEYVQKNLEATLYFIDSSKAFDSIHTMEQILFACGLHKETYGCNDGLNKQKSNGSLTWWRQQLLGHNCWILMKRYINTIFVYTLPRQYA